MGNKNNNRRKIKKRRETNKTKSNEMEEEKVFNIISTSENLAVTSDGKEDKKRRRKQGKDEEEEKKRKKVAIETEQTREIFHTPPSTPLVKERMTIRETLPIVKESPGTFQMLVTTTPTHNKISSPSRQTQKPLPPAPTKSETIKTTNALSLQMKNKNTAKVPTTAKVKAVTPSPTKRKKQKKNGTSLQDRVILEMNHSMKPYTLKSLTNSIPQCTEKQIEYILLSLIDKAIVIEKCFTPKGNHNNNTRSKTLYWANLESKELSRKTDWSSVITLNNHAQLSEVHKAREELHILKQREKLIEKEFMIVKRKPNNEELIQRVLYEEEQLNETNKKLETLHNRVKEYSTEKQQQQQQRQQQKPKIQPQHSKGTTITTSPTIVNHALIGGAQNNNKKIATSTYNLKTRSNKMRQEWKNRKEKCMDFVDQLAEGLEKKLKDIMNIVDIETDEHVGVKMPLKYKLENEKGTKIKS